MQVLSPRKISNDSIDDGPNQPLTVVKSRKSQRRASGMGNKSSINEPVRRQGSEDHSQNMTINSASDNSWDPVTPKPRKIPVSRRSSSYQTGQAVSPTFLEKLRSLSTRRVLSSKTTRRRHDSRVSSESSDRSMFSDESVVSGSCDQSSLIIDPEPPIYLNEFEAHSLDGNSFSNDQALYGSNLDPYMLVPHVSITPESNTLDDGQSSVSVAIEISRQLSQPRAGNSDYDSMHTGVTQPPFIPAHNCDASLSRYGYLYNIKVDILPTAESSVIDLIGDTVVRTISPGSRLLILACIRLGAAKVYKPRLAKRSSENLIADIEYQLGNVSTEYVQVRVNYCHSGFPTFGDALAQDGISAYHTRLETVTTGAIKRHNPASTWSPQPTPACSPLFAIIASHWGPARANDVMHRVTSNRSSLRRAPNWMDINQTYGSENTIRSPSRIGTAPPIPRRQASLKRLSPEKIVDPARKIWTELRQSSSNRPGFYANKANRLSAATTFVGSPHPATIDRPQSTLPESRAEVQRQRNLIRETAVRNKRSIDTESLKSLVPSVVEPNQENKENHIPDSPSPPRKYEMHFDERKREGRWSLGNWW